LNQTEHEHQQRSRRLIALALFAVLAGVLFMYPRAGAIATAGGAAQQQRRRRTPAARRPRVSAAERRGINYSRFLHDSNHVRYDRGRRANCDSCHTLSSPLQYDIKDYPNHPSCVNCHRQQFFTGARPLICTVCHKVSSPRDARRYAFPKPGTNVTREFPGHFPHGLHQDLLARTRRAPETFGDVRLVRASFTAGAADATAQENCATCHALYDKTKKSEEGFFPGAGWPDNMLAGVGTFRKIPEGREGHRTCFVCHASAEKSWNSPSPVANDCAGCHSRQATGSPVSAQTGAAGGVILAAREEAQAVRVSFTNAPLPPRKVNTFQHEGGGEGGSHREGCTTCHINITRAQTLAVKPDVPISSCALCHTTGGRKSSLKKDTDTTINSELKAWLDSRKACLSCHTAQTGSRPPPCSHYFAARRTPPPEAQCR
jgi:hypothetical protein